MLAPAHYCFCIKNFCLFTVQKLAQCTFNYHVSDQCTSIMLQQKEEKLWTLREGSRVTVGDVNIPEDEQLDKEGGLTKRM